MGHVLSPPACPGSPDSSFSGLSLGSPVLRPDPSLISDLESSQAMLRPRSTPQPHSAPSSRIHLLLETPLCQGL